MKISEILKDKYKLRIPPTVYYDLLADVQEVEEEQEQKTGHWIGIDEEPHEDYECDKCGYTISTYTVNIEPHTEYKYCPNCGCRMIDPQESEGE